MPAPVISPPRPLTRQATLWPWVGDRVLHGPAAARHYVGAFYEEATRVLTGATPHQTTSAADICPDLSHGRGHYLEVKALASGSAYLFAHRFAKDRALERTTGGQVLYVYWLHQAPTREAQHLYQLRELLAAHTTEVLAIPSRRLRRAAAGMPTVLLAYRAGMPPEPGFRFSVAQLRDLATGPTCAWNMAPVHGIRMPRVLLSGRIGDLFGPLSETERDRAAALGCELAQGQLEVALVPAPSPRFTGHMVRQVMNRNPSWYARLAASWGTKNRKTLRHRRSNSHDSDIRRPRIIDALDRLARGICRTATDCRLFPLIVAR